MWKTTATSLLLTLSLAGLAQAAPAVERSDKALERATGKTGGRVEQQLAACLILGNQEEIVLGQFAESRAQNGEVKQFAKTMMADHTKVMSMLERFAPRFFLNAMREHRVASKGGPISTAVVGEQADDDPPNSGSSGGNEAATEPAGGSRKGQGVLKTLLNIERQASDNCISLTRNELGQYQGAQFDNAYLGQQIVAHINILAKLKAVEPYASNELRPIIREAAAGTEKHLELARKLMKSQQK